MAVLATMVTQLRKPAAIILNRVPQGAAALREAKNALSTFRLPICPVAVVQRVSHPYASVDGLTASEREPGSRAAEELAQMYAWLGKRAWSDGEAHLIPKPRYRRSSASARRTGASGNSSTEAGSPTEAPRAAKLRPSYASVRRLTWSMSIRRPRRRSRNTR